MTSVSDLVRETRSDITRDESIHIEERLKLERKLDRIAVGGVCFCAPSLLFGVGFGSLGATLHPFLGVCLALVFGVGSVYSTWQFTRWVQLKAIERAHNKWRAIPVLDAVGGANPVAVPTLKL